VRDRHTDTPECGQMRERESGQVFGQGAAE
jgi:hypothetical protein